MTNKKPDWRDPNMPVWSNANGEYISPWRRAKAAAYGFANFKWPTYDKDPSYWWRQNNVQKHPGSKNKKADQQSGFPKKLDT